MDGILKGACRATREEMIQVVEGLNEIIGT
jgi:hypothetical protein